MGKRIEVGGYEFDEKIEGMTLVDSYYIPDEFVEEYKKDREYLAQKAIKIWEKHYPKARRDFAHSEDGEAIVAFNEAGEIVKLIHIDPDGVEELKAADEAGILEDFLLDDF